MIVTLLDIVHISVCLFLMLVVLLQQGKGGGMGAAFGGGATQQVFGGRGAGNLLTRATAVCAAVFMLTSVSLAYFSSSGDRALRARIVQEQRQGNIHEGTRLKATKKAAPADAPKTTDSVPAPAPDAPKTDSVPAPASSP
jgi:preprotein translocase subunit SecG